MFLCWCQLWNLISAFETIQEGCSTKCAKLGGSFNAKEEKPLNGITPSRRIPALGTHCTNLSHNLLPSPKVSTSAICAHCCDLAFVLLQNPLLNAVIKQM